MKPPATQTEEQKRLQQNVEKTTKTAHDTFPNETWVDADKIKLHHVKLPDDADGIMAAASRLPVNRQEEIDFLKEIKSAIILKNKGASVRLIPRIKRLDGKGNLPGPDAIVNGLLYEFKTVTGKIKKAGKRFTESRVQGENVYIRVDNPCHTKAGVLRCLIGIINHKDYKGGYKGNVVFTVGTGRQEKTYFFKIKDLKK